MAAGVSRADADAVDEALERAGEGAWMRTWRNCRDGVRHRTSGAVRDEELTSGGENCLGRWRALRTSFETGEVCTSVLVPSLKIELGPAGPAEGSSTLR